MSKKIYEIVTKKLMDILEAGTVPWSIPWGPGVNEQIRSSGAAYRGFNQMLLTAERHIKGYQSRVWLTCNQTGQFDGKVKKGEHGTPVLFFQFMKKEGKDRAGNPKEITLPFVRFYSVFNLDQTEDCILPDNLTEKPKIQPEPIAECQKIMDNYKGGPPVVHREHAAFYRPTTDEINMPPIDSFKTFAHYFGVWGHEATHSTGHMNRLNRATINQVYHFDRTVRSFEEIIAELGSSYLCGVAGVEAVTIENSGAYVKSWLEYLKNDPAEIVKAASQAQKAAEFIMGIRQEEAEE